MDGKSSPENEDETAFEDQNYYDDVTETGDDNYDNGYNGNENANP